MRAASKWQGEFARVNPSSAKLVPQIDDASPAANVTEVETSRKTKLYILFPFL